MLIHQDFRALQKSVALLKCRGRDAGIIFEDNVAGVKADVVNNINPGNC
jgi:hypothetical protein